MQRLGFTQPKIRAFSVKIPFSLLMLSATLLWALGLFLPQLTQASTIIKTHYHIMVDISSSMKGRGLNRDPHSRNNIILSQNIINLLDSNSTAAISTFGDDAKLIMPDAPITQSYRKAVAQKLEPLTLSDQFTDLLAAFKLANMQLSSIQDNTPKKILLISDGNLDVSHSKKINKKEENELISQILPQLIQNHIQVYAIAHAKISDDPILKKITTDTHGELIDIDSTKNINETLFNQFVSPNENINALLHIRHTFIVDGNPNSLHVVIHHEKPYPMMPDVILHSPIENYSAQSNDEYVRWYHNNQLSLISIIKPTPGVWSVSGIDPKFESIGIINNFQIETNHLLKTLVAGKPFPYSIQIQESSRNVSAKDIQQLFKVAVVAMKGDSVTQSKTLVANSMGVYTDTIQLHENEADKIKIQLLSNTFSRALIRPVMIKPSSEKIAVTPSNDFELSGFKISVSPDNAVFNTQNLSIQPSFTTPINTPFKVTKNVSDQTWTIDVGKIPLQTKVSLILHYNGSSPDNISLSLDSKPIPLEGYLSPEEIKLRKNMIKKQSQESHSNNENNENNDHEHHVALNSHSKMTIPEISLSTIKQLPKRSLIIIGTVAFMLILLLIYVIISSKKEKSRQIEAIKKEFEDV